MTIAVRETALYARNVRTRMPFRFGIAVLEHVPQLLLVAEVEVDGRRATGWASDLLPPKWFTKDPDETYRHEAAAMGGVIERAAAHAREAGSQPSVFDLWRATYRAQERWAAERPEPPLLWHFGVSMVERAAIDAWCRATETPFPEAVRRNTLGIRPGEVYRGAGGLEPADALPERPRARLRLRHTVGLSDPLTEAEIPAGERLDDGLPQALSACIAHYGLDRFKVKLCGDLETDRERLAGVAAVVAERGVADPWFTLDGNEQYKSVESFRAAWEALAAEPRLAMLFRRLLVVEQPLHRSVALSDAARDALSAWKGRPRMIIDESDGSIADLPRALEAGYVGTSHKNCKGVCKGIAARALLTARAGRPPTDDADHVQTAEDLTNLGPVSLPQDLAAVATLGIEHVERNGHHYFRGLSACPEDVQRRMVARHGDLYRWHESGYATLRVAGGSIEVGSVTRAPFGLEPAVAPSGFAPWAQWDPASLGA